MRVFVDGKGTPIQISVQRPFRTDIDTAAINLARSCSYTGHDAYGGYGDFEIAFSTPSTFTVRKLLRDEKYPRSALFSQLYWTSPKAASALERPTGDRDFQGGELVSGVAPSSIKPSACPPQDDYYPIDVFLEGKGGRIELDIAVDGQGDPIGVSVSGSSGVERLDSAAINLARRCLYVDQNK